MASRWTKRRADPDHAPRLAAIARGERPDGVTFRGDEASFAVPAGGDTVLAVRVRMTETGCRVLQWRTAFSGDWETDDRIQVWDGGN